MVFESLSTVSAINMSTSSVFNIRTFFYSFLALLRCGLWLHILRGLGREGWQGILSV